MTRLNILFQRYLQNACTPEQEKELFELLNQNDNPEASRILNELWNSSTHKLPGETSEAILSSILAKQGKIIPIQRKFIWLKAAAVTALIAIAGATTYLLTENQKITTIDKVASVIQQSKFIKLPDGSKVILNYGSKLEFADSFADKSLREVTLTGEAFFDIAHDEAKPFIVHTGKINTTVLGTAFNVKAYPNQDDVTVTVTRGKVQVSNEVKVLGILSPDDQITFNKNDDRTALQSVKSKEVIAWTEKDIFFDNVTMLEASEELSGRFNVNIKFKNENIKACKFTATFIRGEDLRQILDVICEFNQADYKMIEKGVIEVSGDGCLTNHQ